MAVNSHLKYLNGAPYVVLAIPVIANPNWVPFLTMVCMRAVFQFLIKDDSEVSPFFRGAYCSIVDCKICSSVCVLVPHEVDEDIFRLFKLCSMFPSPLLCFCHYLFQFCYSASSGDAFDAVSNVIYEAQEEVGCGTGDLNFKQVSVVVDIQYR